MPFDVGIEGPGIVRSVVPTFEIVAGLAAALVALVGIWLTHGRRGRRALVGALVIALAVGLYAATLHPQLRPAAGGAYATITGFRAEGQLWIANAAADEPIGVVVSVRNSSPAPMRIEGLIEEQAEDGATGRWTAVWVPVDRSVPLVALDRVRPFEPQLIDPQGVLDLYVIGRAGACAVGPSYDPSTDASSFDADMEPMTIQLAYSILGLTSAATLTMAITLHEPIDRTCAYADTT